VPFLALVGLVDSVHDHVSYVSFCGGASARQRQDESVVWMWMGYDGLVDKMRTLVYFVSGGLVVGGWIVD